VVLAELRNEPLSGYDFIAIIRKRFNMLISPGTVYSLLYSLERKQLIESSGEERRRTYTLTEKGKKTIEIIMKKHVVIEEYFANVLKSK
jgi:DNA-binding PadR family transcriptional regulator